MGYNKASAVQSRRQVCSGGAAAISSLRNETRSVRRGARARPRVRRATLQGGRRSRHRRHYLIWRTKWPDTTNFRSHVPVTQYSSGRFLVSCRWRRQVACDRSARRASRIAPGRRQRGSCTSPARPHAAGAHLPEPPIRIVQACDASRNVGDPLENNRTSHWAARTLECGLLIWLQNRCNGAANVNTGAVLTSDRPYGNVVVPASGIRSTPWATKLNFPTLGLGSYNMAQPAGSESLADLRRLDMGGDTYLTSRDT